MVGVQMKKFLNEKGFWQAIDKLDFMARKSLWFCNFNFLIWFSSKHFSGVGVNLNLTTKFLFVFTLYSWKKVYLHDTWTLFIQFQFKFSFITHFLWPQDKFLIINFTSHIFRANFCNQNRVRIIIFSRLWLFILISSEWCIKLKLNFISWTEMMILW